MSRDRMAKIWKVGNSLVIALPAEVCRALNFRRGDYLDLLVADVDTIIARRLKVVTADGLERAESGADEIIEYGK